MGPLLSFLELDREKYVRHSAVKQYRNHKPVSTDTQRTDVISPEETQPVEELTRTRTYVESR